MLPSNGTHTTTTIRLGNITLQRDTNDNYEQTRKCYLLTGHARPLLSDCRKCYLATGHKRPLLTLGNVTSQRETHHYYEQTRKCYFLTGHTRPLLTDSEMLPCNGTQTTITDRLSERFDLQRDTLITDCWTFFLRSLPWLSWPLWNIWVTHDHGYVPFVENTLLSLFMTYHRVCNYVTRLPQRVPLVEQELFTLPEYLNSPGF
jgi:hypothetical protein